MSKVLNWVPEVAVGFISHVLVESRPQRKGLDWLCSKLANQSSSLHLTELSIGLLPAAVGIPPLHPASFSAEGHWLVDSFGRR